MPLSPEQIQELQELEELEQLEQKFGQPQAEQPAPTAGYSPKQLEDPTLQSMMTGMFGMGGVSNTARAAAPGLAQVIGKPFGKAGDYLMQKAAGMKKFIPGIGKTMANEGMVGTKGMLRNQTAKALTKHGQNISTQAAKIPGLIDNGPVADKVGSLAERRILSTGDIPVEESKAVGQILGKARELAQSPAVSGQTQAELRAMAGRRAREMGAYKTLPSAAIKSQLASAEQAGRSEALKKAYGSAFPDQPNLLAQSDDAYSALSKVQEGLKNQEPLSTFNVATKLIPAAIGTAAGGLPGAMVGGAMSTSVGQSLAGRGLIGLEKLIGKSGPIGAQTAVKAGHSQERKR